jgi:hypothetical protein
MGIAYFTPQPVSLTPTTSVHTVENLFPVLMAASVMTD